MSIFSMSYCFARNIFGQVGQGLHAYRIVNLAVVDVLATVLGASFFGYSVLLGPVSSGS